MSRRLRAPLAAGVFFAALGLLLFRVIAQLHAAPDPLERKVLAADRHLYYRVSAAGGPRFELGRDDRTLRFVTHARLPAGAPYDPDRELVYGLRLELHAGDRVLWTRDVYTRARQSKARPLGRLWLDENAFSLADPDLQVTDDRQLVVELPADVPAGALLHVRLVGGADQAFVRVSARDERTPRQRQRRLERLSSAGADPVSDPIGYLPWERLGRAERLARIRFVDRLLPADGHDGVDYRSVALYDSGFRLPRGPEAIDDALVVTSRHAAAVNVVGPALIAVQASRAGADATPAALEIRRVSDGVEPPPPVGLDVPGGGAEAAASVDVPAGIHSLLLTTSAAGGVRVELTAPPGAAAGFGQAAVPALEPDEVLLPAYVAAPASPPVAVVVDGPDDPLGRTLRFDVRLLLGDGAAAPPPTAELTVELEGDRGASLGTVRAPIAAAPAPFETARLFGKQEQAVSEPVSMRVVAPAGTRRIRLRTSAPALLRAQALVALSPPPDVLDVPYRAAPLTTTVWRYAPHTSRGWLPLRADNHAELSPERTAKLAAQIRLEPAPERQTPDLAAEALVPSGRHERQIVLERIAPDGVARALAHWTEGDHTRLDPGRPRRLDLSASPTRAQIRYWADRGALGATAAIVVDGEVVRTETIRSSRGTWDLPPRLRGVHQVAVRTRAGGVRLLIDRPPRDGGGDLIALRTLYELRRAAKVRVAKRSRPLALDAIVYTSSPDADPAASVEIAIDGGAPRRVEGVALAQWTRATATVALPAGDRDPILGFADAAGRGRLYPRLVVIPLGDDLPAGTHTVELRPSAAARGWVRFFVLDGGGGDQQAFQWRRDDGDADEDADGGEDD